MLDSLRSRLLLAILLPAVALFGVAGAAGYVLSRSILEDELGQSLSAVAAAAAAQLSGERLLTIAPDDDRGEGSRTFRNLHRQLTAVRDAAGARRLFAFDVDGRMRVDAGGGLPVGAEVPELARDRLELLQVFAGQRAHSQVLFRGSDGRVYKTGYAPVLHEGKVVGAVGVEATAEFFGPLTRLFWGYAALVVTALGLLSLGAVLTARRLSRPLSNLVESALRIGKGDLDTAVPPEATLEIGILARELEAMRKALASRDRQLKMMLAGVAHEVRNPIGGIELFAGLLAEELAEGASDEPRAHVARIRTEIDYLKRIVEDFLVFAREQKLTLVRLDPSTLLAQARDLLVADAEKRAVTIEVDAASATMDADESLLLAALVNLTKNAVQASPQEAKVLLRGQAVGARYRVEVVDQGPGIPAEARERIFEPFFTTREKGTGLGLPLARRIVQAHGGELTLLPRAGATTFVLELPLPLG